MSRGDDEVVARVNGSPILRRDVERLGQRSLGELAVPSVERRAFSQLVEAAVQSRAIALAAEAELSDSDKLALAADVAAYREQLLVRRYLARHDPPKPVTSAMVADYYRAHPERFGGGSERSVELISTTRGLSAEERVRLLEKLSLASQKADWRAWAAELEKSGVPLIYSSTSANDKLLHPKLRELVSPLAAGQTSEVAFVESRAYVARAGADVARPPRPLADVTPEIERLLLPAQFSGALQQAARRVLPTAKVERTEAAARPVSSTARATPGAR